MIGTFAALLFAHVLADFVLQTGWMIDRKRRPGVMLAHAAIVLATAQAALGQLAAPEILALATAHLLIDAIKTYGKFNGLTAFLTDQAAHLFTLAAVAAYAPHLWSNGLWQSLPWFPGAMALIAGLILATRAGGFAVALLMQPYRNAALPTGLLSGGSLIGLLERGLIFLLVLVGQPAGVGFLVAAKSILRFDTTSKDQSAGEYIIIGTLASFGWALLAVYGTLYLLNALPPLEISTITP